MKLHKFGKTSILLMAAVFLCSGIALADYLANRTVTVTCDPLITPNFDKCDTGDNLTVVNGCDKTIQVKLNNGLYETIPAGGNHVFACTNGPDCYTVDIPDKSLIETGCEFGAVPSLSPWGFGALAALLVLSGWIFMRRRRATA